MNKYQLQDPDVRPAKESDVPAIIELFKLEYGGGYPDPAIYDEEWVKCAICNENVIWLVIDEGGGAIASGTLNLDYGDYNDQLGLIGRLVSHPEGAKSGRERGLLTLGKRMINALVSVAEDNVECVISEARTENLASQRYLERAKLIAAGFLPHYNVVKGKRESLVLYTNVYGEGGRLRSEKLPQVIPEVAPLADRVLSAMRLPRTLCIINDCHPYSDKLTCNLQQVDRCSLARLRQIDRQQFGDPVIFDSVSLDYGMPVLSRKQTSYWMAVDNEQLMGAVGYRVDRVNRIFKITELVFNEAEIIDCLCSKALNIAKREKAQLIEVDLSAYDARIQKTFLNYGFHPVAYIPAMVFHNTYRLDIVKMIKLEIPYDAGEMHLTPSAKDVAAHIGSGLR